MWEQEKGLVFEAAKKLEEASLVVGSQGNISVRFTGTKKNQLIAITPSGINYDVLKPEDITLVDINGKQFGQGKKPSIETMLHLAIYLKRKDVNAIIHSHSTYATSLSISISEIPVILDDQVFYLGGEVPVAKHALPGSAKLAQNIVTALKDKNAVLLSNHGALVTGRNMSEAFFNCQLLERVSQVYIYSRMIGSTRCLPPGIIKKENRLFIRDGDRPSRI